MFDITPWLDVGMDPVDAMCVRRVGYDESKWKRDSCCISPCRIGPCVDYLKLSAIIHADLEKELREKFVKKQRTVDYITDKNSIDKLKVFASGTVAKWAIKHDGINVQMIRVDYYI